MSALLMILAFSPDLLCAQDDAERMTFPGEAWERAAPESQGVRSDRLEAAVAFMKANSGADGVEELMIVRNGYVIWEGAHTDSTHGVWSVTKSFTSTVLGLLIDDGLCTLRTRAAEHAVSMAETFPDVTLEHFATMTSGYLADGDEPRGDYTHGPSRTPFDPASSRLFAPPGSTFAYWDSAMNQFAHVLTRIAGEPIEELFELRIADPIGMNRDRWAWGDFGVVDGLEVNGGAGNAGKGIFISARELARLGHLFLNRGRWGEAQLVSSGWVDSATSVQVPASMPLGAPERSDIHGPGIYGYNWWVNGVGADGTRKWPGAPPGTYGASGYNNNKLLIIPEWDMVVVRLGLDQESDGPIPDAVVGEFLSRLGAAIASGTGGP